MFLGLYISGFALEGPKLDASDTLVFPLAIASNNSVSLADNGGIKKVFPVLFTNKNSTKFCKRSKKTIEKGFRVSGAANTHYLNEQFHLAYRNYETIDQISRKLLEESCHFQRAAAYLRFQNQQSKGIYFHAKGELKKAKEYYLAAYQLMDKWVFNNNAYANILNNMALVNTNLGDYASAFDAYKLSMKLLLEPQKKIDSAIYAVVLNNYSLFLFETGQTSNAIETIDQALLYKEAFVHRSLDHEKLTINKALILKHTGGLEEALTLLNSSKDGVVRKVGKKNLYYANILINLAAVNTTLNKNIRALSQLDKASTLYKKIYGANHLLYAESLINIAHLYEKMRYYAPAEYLYKVILDSRVRKLGSHHRKFTETVFDLAEAKWRNGKSDKATPLFQQGCTNYLKIINQQFTGMSDLERERFWSQIKPSFDTYFDFIISSEDRDSALVSSLYNQYTSIKGLLFVSSNKIREAVYETGDTVIIDLFQQWHLKIEEQVYQYASSGAGAKDLPKLEEEINDLERQISQRVEIRSVVQLTFSEVSEQLEDDEVAIEIIKIDHHEKDTIIPVYAALIIDSKTTYPTLVLHDGGRIEGKAYVYYKNTTAYFVEDTLSYYDYWDWLVPYLSQKKKVYISVDGVYHNINLNTLKTREGHFLIDQVELIQLSNTNKIADYKAGQQKTIFKDVELFGFPHYGESSVIPKLPGTLKELADITDILDQQKIKANKSTWDEACEETIKQVNHPSVLHLATHGFFKEDVSKKKDKAIGAQLSSLGENPLLRSGLYFCNSGDADKEQIWQSGATNDGILTAYEAMSLDLSNTELVVLSACETGIGTVKNGEGVYGLQRAFQVAGAQAVIMSLWKVDDAVTQELMVLFYQKWVISHDRNKAFKESIMFLKEKYKEPYYWGAFVMAHE